MSNANVLIRIVQSLLNAFCGGSSNQHNNQQQQYGQYPGQQPPQQQYQQQQQAYPPQNNQWQQQSQQYPPQQHQQQSWSQVAGAGGASPHQQNNHGKQHHGKPHHNNNNNNHSNYNNNNQSNGYQSHGGFSSGYGGLPAGGILGPHAPQHQNQDQINATNERYQQLRSQARHEGDEAHKCFAASQDAYKSGDGGRAHDLSQQGKNHQKRQDDLDDEAASWIFNENNKQSPVGTIDLHGLYVKEAIERTEAAIAEGQRSGQGELRVIVGKGIHSQGHVAKIKPAVQDLMQKYNLSAHIDPSNTGVLIVDLDGRENNGRTRDAGGLVDEMDRNQGGDCVIM